MGIVLDWGEEGRKKWILLWTYNIKAERYKWDDGGDEWGERYCADNKGL